MASDSKQDFKAAARVERIQTGELLPSIPKSCKVIELGETPSRRPFVTIKSMSKYSSMIMILSTHVQAERNGTYQITPSDHEVVAADVNERWGYHKEKAFWADVKLALDGIDQEKVPAEKLRLIP